MVVKIKKIHDKAITPTRGTISSAGYDLYAVIDEGSLEIPAWRSKKIGTGICAEIPEGYFGAIFARSGLASKHGLRPANCVGVIDSDYRGEIGVVLRNDSSEYRTINSGDRIAQLIILPYLSVDFEDVEELNDTSRGAGGFGSTGSN